MAAPVLRDFVYLDVERVRSFVAQIEQGLPSERTRQSSHEAGVSGSIQGSLPFIATGKGEADYHYLRSQSETSSLHDYIFEEFYRRALASALLQNWDEEAHVRWSRDLFEDGMLVLTSGIFKFLDYHHMLRMLRMSRLIVEIAKKSVQQAGVERPAKMQDIQKQASEFKRLPINEIAQFIDENYDPNQIRVMVFPDRHDTAHLFVGNALVQWFRLPPVTILNTYGAVVDAGWKCLLQVNMGIKHKHGSIRGNTGNELEDRFQEVLEATAAIGGLIHGITFPAVAMTPIAIYREK